MCLLQNNPVNRYHFKLLQKIPNDSSERQWFQRTTTILWNNKLVNKNGFAIQELTITSIWIFKRMSVKRRLGAYFFFHSFFFFAIYLQTDSFWSKKYLLVYNRKSFYSQTGQPCKLPPQHWYFDWQLARSNLQPPRTTCSLQFANLFA